MGSIFIIAFSSGRRWQPLRRLTDEVFVIIKIKLHRKWRIDYVGRGGPWSSPDEQFKQKTGGASPSPTTCGGNYSVHTPTKIGFKKGKILNSVNHKFLFWSYTVLAFICHKRYVSAKRDMTHVKHLFNKALAKFKVLYLCYRVTDLHPPPSTSCSDKAPTFRLHLNVIYKFKSSTVNGKRFCYMH